jgi:hypothetical protein
LGKVQYDSASTEPPQGLAAIFAQSFKPLIGVSFEQTMNDRGKVIDVKVPDQIEQAAKANPQLGAQGLSKEALKRNMQQGSPVFPEQPIAQGESWESDNETELPGGGKAKVKAKYTYVGKEEKLGRMLDRFDMDLNVTLPEGSIATALGSVTLAEHSGTGAMYFDSDQGYMVGSQIDQKMTMTIKAPQGEIKQNVNSFFKIVMKPAE